MVLMNVSTATSPPNFMSTVRCSRNEQLAPTLHSEQQFNQDGGKESVKDWFFFLAGTLGQWYTVSIIRPVAARKCYIPHFCMMTPIYNLHLPSLLTQTGGPKRKPCFQVFISSISTILYSEGGRGVLFTVTSSILMFYPAQQVWQHYSEHISAWLWRNHTLSPLCWQIHGEVGREQGNVCRPIYSGQLSSRSILLDYKKCTASFPSTRPYSFNNPHSSCTDSNESSRFEEFTALVDPLSKYSAFLDSSGTQRTLPNKSALTHSHTVVLLSALKER